MSSQPVTVALAGVGNLGRYICEELLADNRYKVVALARTANDWLASRRVPTYTTDYTYETVLSVLNDTSASILISFINSADGPTFVSTHSALLQACQQSRQCKRFIPSEFAGNIDDFPAYPNIYAWTRVPFRSILRQEAPRALIGTGGVEWTLFENGWLMDYFLPKEKTYMPAIPDEFPVDANGWKVCIRGTGDEPQSWTNCREIAKAVVKLLEAATWDEVTYVAGQWGTFNDMVKVMETFHGKPMPQTHRTVDDIKDSLDRYSQPNGDQDALILAGVEEWSVLGGPAVPKEKTLRQRDQFFSGLKFSSLRELLDHAKDVDFV